MKSQINLVKLRNVRCFSGTHLAKMGKITLLVGQNGTGKSTFMGCYKALAALASLIELEDVNHFDTIPFHMGRFDTIARTGLEDFSIGGTFSGHCHSKLEIEFMGGRDRNLVEKRVSLDFSDMNGSDGSLSIERLMDQRQMRIQTPNFSLSIDQELMSYAAISTWLSRSVRHGILPFSGEPSAFMKHYRLPKTHENIVRFGKLISYIRSEFPMPRTRSFPISAPDPVPQFSRQRTYESFPVSSGLSTEEESRFLADVGNRLGLWGDIRVRRDLATGRFEIQVRTGGDWRNLIDVGFAAYSLMPLLRAMHRSDGGTTFLLQQPEAHVHPSAQAEMAQFMAESDDRFLIETHSEHLTDRFRICVMNKILRPEDLRILYFEPSGDGTSSKIYNIGVDEDANLLDVPNNYRSFFMKETRRLLGFES